MNECWCPHCSSKQSWTPVKQLPSCHSRLSFLLQHSFCFCIWIPHWNPVPRIAGEHLRPSLTPEGAENERPSVCSALRPTNSPEVYRAGLKEWQRANPGHDLFLQLSLPSASSTAQLSASSTSETEFCAVKLIIPVVHDRCAGRIRPCGIVTQHDLSLEPLILSGGGSVMPEFTAEPSGGVVGKTQWNICDGRRSLGNPDDSLILHPPCFSFTILQLN